MAIKNSTTFKLHLRIRPEKGMQFVDFRELKQYKDLFYFFVVRDIKVKYKQTVLGGLWAIIQPLCTMVVFTLFFGNLAKMPSDGIPYPIFSFSALVAWTYFANAINAAGNSLVGNAGLISKIYFPRLIIPLTPVLAGLLDFAIALVFLIGMMIYYNIYPTAMIFALPLLILLMMLTATGFGALLAALNAKYRDVRYAIPFLIQLWMFASPIVYPASLVPEKYRILYALNPMTGVIEGFRSALLGNTRFPTDMVLIAAGISIFIFILGIAYFRQTESDFADII